MHDRRGVAERHGPECSLSSALRGPSCCHYFRWCWTYSRSHLWYKHKGDRLRVLRQLTISFACLSSSYVKKGNRLRNNRDRSTAPTETALKAVFLAQISAHRVF